MKLTKVRDVLAYCSAYEEGLRVEALQEVEAAEVRVARLEAALRMTGVMVHQAQTPTEYERVLEYIDTALASGEGT